MAKYYTYLMLDNGQRVDFVLDTSKRRNCSLAVQEGRLIVRVPLSYEKETVKKLITHNLDWIEKALTHSAKQYGLPQEYKNGEEFRLLGENLAICTEISDRYFPVKISAGKLIVSVCPTSDEAYLRNEIFRFIAELAEREIRESMERLTVLTGLYPKKVTIKDMTASWGRCSSKGDISINYKVVSYSKKHIDYVCIHELCHLKYMDHSSDFWNLVGKYCPDYKQIRDSMK